MTEFDTKPPGIYLEEVETAGPIAGAGTSTAALIGTVAGDSASIVPNKPVLVTNWTQYAEKFGEFKKPLSLPYAVRGFFENGGTLAYIVPVTDMAELDNALAALTHTLDVSIVCLPGETNAATQASLITHCETMGDRFAVLDGARTPDNPADTAPVHSQRDGLMTDRGFGALYWPWIVINDPEAPASSPGRVTVAPSGHIAGVMARSDSTRGVHKAPANEVIRGALDLEYQLNDDEQGVLNNLNINALRTFPGGPPLVWGARALSKLTAWQYVNVRRLVAYISDSLLQGLRWAVFQPNNTALWKALERTVTEFLTRVWQSGALFGRTAAEAFYVKIDEELNPDPVRALGRVFIEIGLAPTRPAEQIVIRLGLWSGSGRVSEV
ncbi:phage tail sheath subtilisin-like domain-containing protein [Streptomyces sp. IBSBF 2953]|uniref:phage tail sheath family protein n=1 Tax=Streptomyces TaxID=1883 RepID=UPI00211A6700|nr:phage tail sheath subtilisin-like domain-containing protein [Streptomyces scabiei]MCQ9181336.1 phage tail sheath subtilisin-like domain-containing protein [Streptomyces hayashii]MDX3117083.1 phage tail sheath subtilisin-like domain-containing protein [Streptomyces scabiei]